MNTIWPIVIIVGFAMLILVSARIVHDLKARKEPETVDTDQDEQERRAFEKWSTLIVIRHGYTTVGNIGSRNFFSAKKPGEAEPYVTIERTRDAEGNALYAVKRSDGTIFEMMDGELASVPHPYLALSTAHLEIEKREKIDTDEG